MNTYWEDSIVIPAGVMNVEDQSVGIWGAWAVVSRGCKLVELVFANTQRQCFSCV